MTQCIALVGCLTNIPSKELRDDRLHCSVRGLYSPYLVLIIVKRKKAAKVSGIQNGFRLRLFPAFVSAFPRHMESCAAFMMWRYALPWSARVLAGLLLSPSPVDGFLHCPARISDCLKHSLFSDGIQVCDRTDALRIIRRGFRHVRPAG